MTKEEIREVLDSANPDEVLQFIDKLTFYVLQMEARTKIFEIVAGLLCKLKDQRDRRITALNVIDDLLELLKFQEVLPILVDATVKPR